MRLVLYTIIKTCDCGRHVSVDVMANSWVKIREGAGAQSSAGGVLHTIVLDGFYTFITILEQNVTVGSTGVSIS